MTCWKHKLVLEPDRRMGVRQDGQISAGVRIRAGNFETPPDPPDAGSRIRRSRRLNDPWRQRVAGLNGERSRLNSEFGERRIRIRGIRGSWPNSRIPNSPPQVYTDT